MFQNVEQNFKILNLDEFFQKLLVVKITDAHRDESA